MYLPTPPQLLSNLKMPNLLTPAQITAKLTGIPVFILTNPEGAALTATPPDGKGNPTVGVFFRRGSAVAFLEGLKKQNAALGTTLRINAVSLSELWQRSLKPENKMTLAFIPDPTEVEKAKVLLKQQGKPDVGGGVPLFMAELPGKRLLNVTQNNTTVVPVFFSLADLMPVMEKYNKARPVGTDEAHVVLISLESLLGAWSQSPDVALKQIQLIVPKVVADEVKPPAESKPPIGTL